MNDRVKEELVDWIAKPGNEDLLESLQLMKEASTLGDWYDGLSKAEKKSIQRGEKDHDEGRVLSSREFWNKHGLDSPNNLVKRVFR